LDYLSRAGTGTGGRTEEFGLMLQNLAAVTANYRKAGIQLFVVAYLVRSPGEVAGVRAAPGCRCGCRVAPNRLPAWNRSLSTSTSARSVPANAVGDTSRSISSTAGGPRTGSAWSAARWAGCWHGRWKAAAISGLVATGPAMMKNSQLAATSARSSGR